MRKRDRESRLARVALAEATRYLIDPPDYVARTMSLEARRLYHARATAHLWNLRARRAAPYIAGALLGVLIVLWMLVMRSVQP